MIEISKAEMLWYELRSHFNHAETDVEFEYYKAALDTLEYLLSNTAHPVAIVRQKIKKNEINR